VEHRPGQLHSNADGLSRLPWDEDAPVKDRRDATLIQSVNMEPLSRDSLRETENQDPVLLQVVKWLKTGVRSPRGDVDIGDANATVLVTVGKAIFEVRFGV